MLNMRRVPTYTELVNLSDAELTSRVAWLSIQLKQANQQGKNVTEQTKVYMIYKNEFAKRNYENRIR